ncbi:MAG TPA: hypothetical protein VM840_02485 [Actinomycetota bacterium]|nr:hypothetical protein [Actinomycetota bacterium]
MHPVVEGGEHWAQDREPRPTGFPWKLVAPLLVVSALALGLFVWVLFAPGERVPQPPDPFDMPGVPQEMQLIANGVWRGQSWALHAAPQEGEPGVCLSFTWEEHGGSASCGSLPGADDHFALVGGGVGPGAFEAEGVVSAATATVRIEWANGRSAEVTPVPIEGMEAKAFAEVGSAPPVRLIALGAGGEELGIYDMGSP